MQNSWERLFTCDKCGRPIAIKKMKGKNKLFTIGRCPNLHYKRFTLSYASIDEWIALLDTHLFKCVKCDIPPKITIIFKGIWVKVQLRCSTHGSNKACLVPMIIYNKIMQTRKKDKFQTPFSTSSTLNCQICGAPAKYIPQYRRYYCYRCQQYVEEQKVVEKVRYPPEISDLRLKLKNFANKSEKRIPIAICDIPFELKMPNVDTSKIEEILQEMILRGELEGEVDSATGYVSFFEPGLVPKTVLTATTIQNSPTVTAPSHITIEVVRGFDYVGGQVRFKVVVRNKSKFVITNIGVELDIPTEFKLIRILPDSSLDVLNKGLSKIDKLMPNSSQGIDYFLEPVTCGTGVIAGLIKYLDVEGHYKSIEIKPKEIVIKCPLIFTPEEANIAMIRNLTNTLIKDYRRWALPTNPQETFKLLHEMISQFEISHIQSFQISDSPYEMESWYYTRTKTTNHPITMQINISEQKNYIDLTIACEDMAELTGLLAKISEDFQMNILQNLQIDLKPAFGNLKQLLCECGSPISKLPTISETVVCNNCQKAYSWEILG
ncbi:MAG: hypothetical protein ACFFD2_13730 [Promethearchaeota archaeon]